MLQLLPHTHVFSVQDDGHPYMMLTRSQRFCLLNMHPSSSIGRVVSRDEAPLLNADVFQSTLLTIQS